MRLENLRAYPDPAGNQISLSWTYPDGSGITGVHIRRKTGTHSTSIDDGDIVSVPADVTTYTDSGLKGNTIYYYSFYPYVADPGSFSVDRHNRIHAMATSHMAYAQHMYELLPLIYLRYDKSVPEDPSLVAEEDREKGQLRRFVDVLGGQLDLLHSYAQELENAHSAQRADGGMLPLLAQWIGWRLDLKQELDDQRNEIDNAPEVYKSIGIIPAVQHTVKRISNWESQSKEFVHNIFLTNRPERMNIWSLLRDDVGDWSAEQEMFSLDYSYEGRPSFSQDANQVRWLFYHTMRNQRWEIWCKTSPTYSLALGVLDYFDNGTITEHVRLVMQQAGIFLSADTVLSQTGDLWRFDDVVSSESYLVERNVNLLTVYHLTADETRFAPSIPIVRTDNIGKYPSSGFDGNTLWLFWSEYDRQAEQWHIHYRHHINGVWSVTDIGENTNSPFRTADVIDTSTPRYKPNCVVDREGNLWLFWLEKSAGGWQMKYNKRTGGTWGTTAMTLPAGSIGQFRLDADPSVLTATTAGGPQIYIFWSHNVATGTGDQTRWQIDFQVKTDLLLDEANWHGVYSNEKDPVDDDYHDREPIAVINPANDIELFWSSNRSGNWAIWSSILTDVNTTTDTVTWGAATQATGEYYSNRDPLPLLLADQRLLLLARSNKSPQYTSEYYRAMSNLDHRYAGCTTRHVRNMAKTELTGKFVDFSTYTYDTGTDGKRDNDDFYARDTIGVYLKPESMDKEKINREITRLRPIVREFMPLTDRAVFVAEDNLHTDYVYHYGLPPAADSRYIISTYQDDFTSLLSESMLGPEEDFIDTLS